mmetsp:Transcript_32286/g.47076  ORF Transcript_32286/g.47076 Transcript_32286/m.47076 type:complete len:120 (-) Transcript_32286:1355-1714(-)
MKRHDHTKQRRRHPLATSFSFHKSAFLVILVLLSSSVVVNAAFAPSRVGSATTSTTSIMNTPLKRRNENTPSLHQLNPTPFLHTTLRGGGGGGGIRKEMIPIQMTCSTKHFTIFFHFTR